MALHTPEHTTSTPVSTGRNGDNKFDALKLFQSFSQQGPQLPPVDGFASVAPGDAQLIAAQAQDPRIGPAKLGHDIRQEAGNINQLTAQGAAQQARTQGVLQLQGLKGTQALAEAKQAAIMQAVQDGKIPASFLLQSPETIDSQLPPELVEEINTRMNALTAGQQGTALKEAGAGTKDIAAAGISPQDPLQRIMNELFGQDVQGGQVALPEQTPTSVQAAEAGNVGQFLVNDKVSAIGPGGNVHTLTGPTANVQAALGELLGDARTTVVDLGDGNPVTVMRTGSKPTDIILKIPQGNGQFEFRPPTQEEMQLFIGGVQ